MIAVSIPHSIRIIDHDAFYNTKIESLVIPSSVEEIKYAAFSRILSLKYILFEPGKLTHIGDRVFAYFNNVKKIVLPSSVISIGSSIFYDLTEGSSLDLIYCGKTHIGNENIFYNQSANITVYVTDDYKHPTFGGRVPVVLENKKVCEVYYSYYKLTCPLRKQYFNMFIHIWFIFFNKNKYIIKKLSLKYYSTIL